MIFEQTEDQLGQMVPRHLPGDLEQGRDRRHHAVGKKHLPAYLDEFVLRFNPPHRQAHQPPLRPPNQRAHLSRTRHPTQPDGPWRTSFGDSRVAEGTQESDDLIP
jgi:hypothetical protein